MRLEGKQALVTGGRQGIGRGIVEAFLREGAFVTTCGRGPKPEGLPGGCGWVQANVAEPEVATALLAEFDRLDILVNNAGVQVEKTVADSTDVDWDLVIGVNCRGVFNCCRTAIPKMAEGGVNHQYWLDLGANGRPVDGALQRVEGFCARAYALHRRGSRARDQVQRDMPGLD